MASSSRQPKPSILQRFNDYLDGLREEFQHQLNATSTESLSQRRFNVYLGNLTGEFKLMGLEIESLWKEIDDYREKGLFYFNTMEISYQVITISRQSRNKRRNFGIFPTIPFVLDARRKRRAPVGLLPRLS
jgi:hypothetical protein